LDAWIENHQGLSFFHDLATAHKHFFDDTLFWGGEILSASAGDQLSGHADDLCDFHGGRKANQCQNEDGKAACENSWQYWGWAGL
jgi:hypothetical protein